jgi:hypothetical protein
MRFDFEFPPSYVHCLEACERSHRTLEERLSSYVNKNGNDPTKSTCHTSNGAPGVLYAVIGDFV